MAVVLGRERLALPQPPVDAPDLAAVPRARRARLDAQLGRPAARPRARAGPATHAVSAALFASYPLLAVARLARRAARDDGGALPARRARTRATTSRSTCAPSTRSARAAPGSATPPTSAPAQPPTGSRLVHVLRRRGRRRRTPSRRRCRARAGPADWIAIGDSTFGPARRARARGGRRAARAALGARDARRRRAAAPPPARVDVPRAAAAHQAREPAAERDVRRHGCEVGGRARSRSRAGPAWPATTGAPSTPRPGSGCTASRSTASRARGSTCRSAACASARC